MRAKNNRVGRTSFALLAGFVGVLATMALAAAPVGAQTGLASGDAVALDDSTASGTAFAEDGSTASGDAVAIDNSTASGCSEAIDDSTASGGALAVDGSTASGGQCPQATTTVPTTAPPATAAPTIAPPTTATETTPTTTPNLARTGAAVIRLALSGVFVALAGGLVLGWASRRWPAAFYGW